MAYLIQRHFKIILSIAATLAITILSISSSFSDTSDRNKIVKAGVQAYLYGLPIVLMDRTSKMLTKASTEGPEGELMNQFKHAQVLRDYRFKAVVRPNNDTLPSSAFLDLKKEPVVLSVPEIKDRYFSFAFLDAWSNSFTSRGIKELKGKPSSVYPVHYVVTGPDWKGTLPKGLQQIKAPTNLVWLLGRTEVKSRSDLKNAIAIQKRYKLRPLSRLNIEEQLPLALSRLSYKGTGTPRQQVKVMSAETYFNTLMKIMPDNPPAAADKKMVALMKGLGLKPSRSFNFTDLPKDIRDGLSAAIPAAKKFMLKSIRGVASRAQWSPDPTKVPLGEYGTRYVLRAIVADIGFGALKNEDAVYQGAKFDDKGQPLTGDKKYIIHFPAKKTPPVNAFWSVSLYDKQGYFIKNEISRHSLGSNSNMKYNSDGSLDVYIQKEPPEKGKDSNWLPSPAGAFELTLRMYWPKQEVLNGKWKAPVLRVLE